jgi:hypothetical protein
MMTFEGQSVQGIEAIVEKYKVRATRAQNLTTADARRTFPSPNR